MAEPKTPSSIYDNDGPDKRPRFSWTIKSRLVVLILSKWYEITIDDIAVIFNRLFRKELASYGFFCPGHGRNGISPRVLDTQLYDLARYSDPAYEETYKLYSFEQTLQKHGNLCSEISLSARTVGVELLPRQVPRAPIYIPSLRRRRETSEASDLVTPAPDEPDSDRERAPKSCKKSSETPRKAFVPKRQAEEADLPRIGFRTYSASSAGTNSPQGFVAEAFLHGESCHIGDAIEYARRHFIPDSRLHSPLISITDSLLWCLKKALSKRVAGESGIGIAMFDITAIQGTIWRGSDMVTAVKKSSGTGNLRFYKGAFEFLVWQRIPQQAIIKCFTLKELEEFLECRPRVFRVLRYNDLVPGQSATITRASFESHDPDQHASLVEAIGELVRFMKPRVYWLDPFIGHFVRMINHDFKVSHECNFLEEFNWKPIVNETLFGSSDMDGLRSINELNVQQATPPSTPLLHRPLDTSFTSQKERREIPRHLFSPYKLAVVIQQKDTVKKSFR